MHLQNQICKDVLRFLINIFLPSPHFKVLVWVRFPISTKPHSLLSHMVSSYWSTILIKTNKVDPTTGWSQIDIVIPIIKKTQTKLCSYDMSYRVY